jgi:hypothetical protein
LLLGKGGISVCIVIPSFLNGDPIDYLNPEFVFEEIKKGIVLFKIRNYCKKKFVN